MTALAEAKAQTARKFPQEYIEQESMAKQYAETSSPILLTAQSNFHHTVCHQRPKRSIMGQDAQCHRASRLG